MDLYRQAHDRVRALRGRARDHVCVDCGDRAREWSYRNFCEEQREFVIKSGQTAIYCEHPEHYDPRCRLCHIRQDRSGESHHGAKLTEQQVQEIRAIYAAGAVTQATLAERFGVAKQTISRAIRGDLWAGSDGIVSTENKGNRARGETHPKAKLTCADVREIRRRVAEGETQVAVAAAYGVSDQLISQIVRRKIWQSCI